MISIIVALICMLTACLQIEHRKSNTQPQWMNRLRALQIANHYIWEGGGVGGEGRGVNNKNCVSGVASFSSVCIQSQTEEQKHK